MTFLFVLRRQLLSGREDIAFTNIKRVKIFAFVGLVKIGGQRAGQRILNRIFRQSIDKGQIKFVLADADDLDSPSS